MEPVKVVQTWNPIPGKMQEYAAFITQEFQPCLKSLDLEIISGWYTLVGGGSKIMLESWPTSLSRVKKAVDNEKFQLMTDRLRNLVTHYASRVFAAGEWMTEDCGSSFLSQAVSRVRAWDIAHGQREIFERFVSDSSFSQAVLYIQSWDILPGQREIFEHFVREKQLPQMEAIGLPVTSEWRLIMGAGPQMRCESVAPNLDSLANSLKNERYLRLVMSMEELVTNYDSRVLIQHRGFLNMLHQIYGRAIRAVAPDEMNPMVGPFAD